MARDLTEAEVTLVLDDSLLRQEGQFFSSGYNFILQRNAAYTYLLPQLVGNSVGNDDGHTSINTVFKYYTYFNGSKVSLFGTAFDSDGELLDGTWKIDGIYYNGGSIVSFGTYYDGWFNLDDQAVSLGQAYITGTFIPSASATQKTLSVFKREGF
jgi:hypothetical protein